MPHLECGPIPSGRRVATISFAVEGRNASEIPTALDPHQMRISMAH